MSYWLGPVFSKFLRLFVNLVLSIHLFACAYWRVKVCQQDAYTLQSLKMHMNTCSATPVLWVLSSQLLKLHVECKT